MTGFSSKGFHQKLFTRFYSYTAADERGDGAEAMGIGKVYHVLDQ